MDLENRAVVTYTRTDAPLPLAEMSNSLSSAPLGADHSLRPPLCLQKSRDT